MISPELLSGISGCTVAFKSPSGNQQRFLCVPTLIAGSTQDGTWRGTISFPQFIEAGTWTIDTVILVDSVRNQSILNTEVLRNLGFPTDLSVTSNEDLVPPQLQSLSLSPSTIDVSSAPQTVTISRSLRDEVSGIDNSFQNSAAIVFRSPSGQQRINLSNAFTLAGGTIFDGTWQKAFNLRQFSEPGTWRVEVVNLFDLAGNTISLDAMALQALGIATVLNVNSFPSDTSSPTLTGFSFSPTVIDTATGPQNVVVTLDVSDMPAGIVPLEMSVEFTSPSGAQRRSLLGFQLISGNTNVGRWTGTLTMPQFSEAGTWKVRFVIFLDATGSGAFGGNRGFMNTAALNDRGFPTNLNVILPSLVVDGIITNPAGGGTVTDEVFGARAQVIFPPGVLSQVTSVGIDVFQDPLNIPTPSGFEGPGTRFVNINLTPRPAFPLLTPGLTSVLPLVNLMIPGDRIDLYRVDPTTGNLVPAIGVNGMPVVGTVNPDGLSATFTGIASLSVVVGLIPEVVAVAIDIKPGANPNNINLSSTGRVPVAILSTATFDARTVNAGTVTLAKAPVVLKPNGRPMAGFEDSNADGLLDPVVHVDAQALQLSQTATEAVLEGKLLDNRRIRGMDSVRVVH